MKATEQLHNVGQSLWLDNITRGLLTSGTLKRYIDTLSITGLTSNPTIFDHAISKSAFYDEDIRAMTKSGVPGEDLFFRLAIADLQQAADKRLLFASTGTKDPRASDTLYIGALAAPNTVNTIPEETLLHFADHGEIDGVLPRDGGRASETLSAIVKEGVDLGALAAGLQSEGSKTFDESWSDLLKAIETKSQALT
jgi:transaldolase